MDRALKRKIEDACGLFQSERTGPAEIISWATQTFRPIALICGLGRGSGVLIEMTSEYAQLSRFYLDTKWLHQESYDLIAQYERLFGVSIAPIRPTEEDVKALPVPNHDLFSKNRELRQRCCDVRKGKPLEWVLRDHAAWISSLRPDPTLLDRQEVLPVSIDEKHGGVIKICPLVHWTAEKVEKYAQARGIPTHPLGGEYGSVGCADPCTVPGKGREGRWPWGKENPEGLFCGIHKQ